MEQTVFNQEPRGLDLAYNEVKKFHQAFNHPVGDFPTALDYGTRLKRGLWILEEVIEGIVSASIAMQVVLEGLTPENQECDLEVMIDNANQDIVVAIYNAAQLGVKKASDNIENKISAVSEEDLTFRDLKDQVDADVDVLYFTLGNLVQMGVKPQKIFEAVQKANMGKLHEDGKPRYDPANGNKIVKPATWKSPDEDIEAELLTQMNNYIDDKD